MKRRWQAAREKLAQVNPDTKIMLHSCGAVKSFIPHLIDSGIDILDPVQPTAQGMDPEGLKSQFNNQIVFHGGVDVQHLLPCGTAEQVKAETIRCLKEFHAHLGGFIAAPSHSVQPDVPPENIVAMIEAVKSFR